LGSIENQPQLGYNADNNGDIFLGIKRGAPLGNPGTKSRFHWKMVELSEDFQARHV